MYFSVRNKLIWVVWITTEYKLRVFLMSMSIKYTFVLDFIWLKYFNVMSFCSQYIRVDNLFDFKNLSPSLSTPPLPSSPRQPFLYHPLSFLSLHHSLYYSLSFSSFLSHSLLPNPPLPLSSSTHSLNFIVFYLETYSDCSVSQWCKSFILVYIS